MDNVLIYVRLLNENTDGTYTYQLFFSETPEVVWGNEWDEPNPSSVEDLTPEESTYSKIIEHTSKYKWQTIQETSCYSMEYAIRGCIALSWVNLNGLEEYPESRYVLHFGDTEEKVNEILNPAV